MVSDDLFEATVPVFQHYIERIEIIVSRTDDGGALTMRLAPDTFSAGEHFETSQGFALRTVFPLIGEPIPDLSTDQTDRQALIKRCHEVQELLRAIKHADFDGAHRRRIRHTAGKAELQQDATEFVTLYALPNFFFHLTMGYATLRHVGIDLGKSDFDGQHVYPVGFRFPE